MDDRVKFRSSNFVLIVFINSSLELMIYLHVHVQITMKTILDSFAGRREDFQSRLKSHYKNWFQAVKDSDDVVPYIATPTSWEPTCNSSKGDTMFSVLKEKTLLLSTSVLRKGKRDTCSVIYIFVHFTLFNL